MLRTTRVNAFRQAPPDGSATVQEPPELVDSPVDSLHTPAQPPAFDEQSIRGDLPQQASTSPSCASYYLHFSPQQEEYL